MNAYLNFKTQQGPPELWYWDGSAGHPTYFFSFFPETGSYYVTLTVLELAM